jgi:hypothetical protein
MTDRVRVAIIPRDSDSTPSRSDNRALIGCAGFPANAVASFEKSGLVAGHLTIQAGLRRTTDVPRDAATTVFERNLAR